MSLRRALAILISTTLLLAACGGGGGVGTGGTGGYAAGPITGFGSVIVNDIVFDDSGAEVRDGDDGTRLRAELKLGMTVEVDSEAIQNGAARATRVRFDSALVGPVDSVDPAAGRFVVLGQTVTVDDTTVFDERLFGRLALLVPGGWVEVYALYDPALQRFRATRVEARLVQPLVYRVRGIVTGLDTATSTFRIGNATFGYAAAGNVPADLRDGQFVRLAVRTAPPVAGRYSVAAFSTAVRSVGDLDGVVVKGLVSRFTSSFDFAVDGRPVDASSPTVVFQGGLPALGLRVEVEGAVRNGVLRARTVKLRTDDEERERGFDLRGAIESVGATLPRSFVLRGLTINTNRTDIEFRGGTASDLALGRCVRVRAQIASTGTALEATRVEFESTCR